MPNELLFIWLKMINRINISDRVLAVRNCFNNAMEQALAGCSQHYVLDVSSALNDASYFSLSQKSLNATGQTRFWLKLDSEIENFESQPEKPKFCHEDTESPQDCTSHRDSSRTLAYSRQHSHSPRRQDSGDYSQSYLRGHHDYQQ